MGNNILSTITNWVATFLEFPCLSVPKTLVLVNEIIGIGIISLINLRFELICSLAYILFHSLLASLQIHRHSLLLLWL